MYYCVVVVQPEVVNGKLIVSVEEKSREQRCTKISVEAHGRPFSHASNDDVKILRSDSFVVILESAGP